jgi:DNA modification methylase
MNVDVVLIDDLELDPNNARRHSKKNLDAIAASLERFGQRKPIVVWRNRVVAGNGTLVAARSLGWREISVARCPDDWDELQVKAFALADNRSAELAEWDEQVLNAQLQELELAEFDVEAIGFETTVEPEPVVEDEIPEVVEPKAKLGDVWLLGRHRLVCGDATDTATVQKLMQGNDADLIFTDPPYNLDFQGQRINAAANAKHDDIKNDNLSLAEFDDFISKVLRNYASMNAKAWYFFFSDLTLDMLLVPMRQNGFSWKSILIWMKPFASMSSKDYKSRYEPFVYGCKSNAFYGQRYNDEDIWQFARVKTNDLHPTMKPLDLIAKALNNSSQPNDIVVDLFGGSGSTLIACEQTNRTCFMMELDPKYVDVIIARWEKLTGDTAVLIEG